MTSNEYQCAHCKGVFERTRSDAEAASEATQNWPAIPLEEMDQVCNDCFVLLVEEYDVKIVAKPGSGSAQ